MKDEPFGEEAFRNHRSDESSEIYYRKMRHAQRIFAKYASRLQSMHRSAVECMPPTVTIT